jgi:putative ABC transport system permease protein
VVAQVSTSLMLLTASFLMARSFQRGMLSNTDFVKDHLLISSFDPRFEQYNAAQSKQFYKLFTERVRQMPGVQGATLMHFVPFGQEGIDAVAFVPEGFVMPRDRANFSSAMDTVDEEYFKTIGIPILRGRGFLASDTADSPRVAVVNDQFAKHYWPNADPMGKHIRLDNASGVRLEIVGVARTIKYQDNSERPMDMVYLPLAQHPVSRMTLMLRSSGDPLQLIPPLKDIVRALDVNMPMLQTRSYEELYLNWAVRAPKIGVDLAGAMGTVGLVLTLAGLYGLIAYNVSRRTREIGIRIALGAGRNSVLRLMMGKGLLLVGIGMIFGLLMGFGMERAMNSMLFDAGDVDLVAYLIVVPSLLAATMLAAYIPARRAAHISPTQALRYE